MKEGRVLVGNSQELELRNSDYALGLLQNHMRQAGAACAYFSSSGWKASLHWIRGLEKDSLPMHKFLPPKVWAESYGLPPDHELHQAEIKAIMELKDGANDLPISSQGVKRPRQAGLVSDAAAEKQMCANGNNADGMSDKALLMKRARALRRLQNTIYHAGDRAFSLAGWKPIAQPLCDALSRTGWKFVPSKEWADANGVDNTTALTVAAVKEITLQRAGETRSRCKMEHIAGGGSSDDSDESVPMTSTQEAAQPEKGTDHLAVQLAAAQESLTQQRSEHAAVETRLKIEAEVLKRQLKEKTDVVESQAACIETLTKERAASEEQWIAKVEALRGQLEQQAGMTADQTARTEKLEAALEAAEAAATAAQEDARPAEASSDLSDSHILLRAARIMQMDPALKQELLSVINM